LQGIYGYPLEIQALFFFALRCARSLLLLRRLGPEEAEAEAVGQEGEEEEEEEFIARIDKRLAALRFHVRQYYWLDFPKVNQMYRYKTDEYSRDAANKFNVFPDSIPEWVFGFVRGSGGYFIGNVSPTRNDFRWFGLGNCAAVLSSLATPRQAAAVMELVAARWPQLVGDMPLKASYPALDGHEWRVVTGCDPKNTRWSYHNGGSWPGLATSLQLLLL
jgi:hypothetical protein